MKQLSADLEQLTRSNETFLKDRYGAAYPFWLKATEYLMDKETSTLDLIEAKKELEESLFELESIEAHLETIITKDTRLTNEQSRKAALKRLKQEDDTWVKLSRERIPNQKEQIVKLELYLSTLSRMYSLVTSCLTVRED